ncbi:hypothetical protein E6H31_04725 [Candidatus Bathyarchaeota archaeon]|nr:MAG: hypothetical protein E6H31_04725 [Candidatus Bathyarchaeota archaeon]
MKNSRVLLILFASILLILPTARATTIPNSATLISGTVSLYGTVNVSDLQNSQGNQNNVGRAPLHAQGEQLFQQAKDQANSNGFIPADEGTKTVVTAPATATPLTPTVGLVLEGAVGASPNPCGCTPPDGAVGAGPNHVFSMVNTAGIIYTKTGSLVRGTFGLDSFFGVPGHSLSDPQVSFDANSGRWFSSIIDINTNNVLVAVSTSNDPTGTFNLYSISDPNHLPDQPVTGTNDDKYVVSVNDFNTAGTLFIGVHYFVLNKAQLVAGNPTISTAQNTPDPNMFSLHPAQHLTSSTTFYLVTDCTGSCVSSPSSTTTTETVVSLTGVPPGSVSVNTSSFSISTSVIGPNARQPGTSTLLVTNDNRVESVVWESNSLWAAWNDACVPSGDTQTRTCLRLVQATTSGATATKNQDFDFATNGGYYFYPAVTSSQGSLAVSFGTSSSSVFPSAMAAGRASTDPINTLQSPTTIRAGSADDTSTRYGDYFGAATDPTPTTSSTFWLEAEYRKDSTFQNWNTVISQIGAFGGGGGSFDFSISLSPSSGSIGQGSTTTSTVTVSLVSGTSQTVSLSATVSPLVTNGPTASLNPPSGNPTFTSTLTVSTSSSTPTGTYMITVTGTGGSVSHSGTYTLTVTAPPPGDFSISASPTSLTIHRTASGSVTITVSSLNGFTGTVSLSATPVTGVTETFNPTSVNVPANGSASATLTFQGSSGDSRGTFTITVTGTSGSLSHSTTVTLTILKH